jgi:hypothetical protein
VSTQPTRTTSSIRSLMPMLFPCLAYGHVRSPSPGPKSYPSRVCFGRGFSCSGGTRNVVDKSRYMGDAGLGGLPNGCEYFYHSLAFDKPEPKRVFFSLSLRFVSFNLFLSLDLLLRIIMLLWSYPFLRTTASPSLTPASGGTIRPGTIARTEISKAQ